MDQFVGFNFVVLDASDKATKAQIQLNEHNHRERVDLIARQFRDVLLEGDQSDSNPHGLVLTSDFKVARSVRKSAGWISFWVDRGDGKTELLEEVAMVVFARLDDREGQEGLKKLEPFVHLNELPPAPLVAAVKLSRSVPLIVSEWYGKSVAGFFSE
jgi:hypothetical protein